MDINEGLPKMVDEWTPLEYLRHFALHRKKITTDPRYIYFGRVKFYKSTKTNFQAEYGDRDDDGVYPWYTLDHLYQAYLSKVKTFFFHKDFFFEKHMVIIFFCQIQAL